MELRLSREPLRDQQPTDAGQDERLNTLETVVDDLQQQLLHHTVVTPALTRRRAPS